MSQHQRLKTPPPRLPESVVELVSECRDYLDWEERRLSSILKCLRESHTKGAASPFEILVDGQVWNHAPGLNQRMRIQELIGKICGTSPSHSSLSDLIRRLPFPEVQQLQERRDTLRGLAQAVQAATRGWMRRISIMQLGVECTLQELTGGRCLPMSYDDHGQISTGTPYPVINFRT